ncbi:Nibrin [Labeo rohita]|uniref:Nibrin n=1 Tax=Labeo rohita TaxID=84645 RepID=A0ABQ8L015_LABRO|nr:Nibrin [Labeo rohita]
MAEGGADSSLFGIGRQKYLMQFSGTKSGQSAINFRPNDHTVKENYMVHDVNQTFPVTSTSRPDKMEISSNRDVGDIGVLVKELGQKIGESVTTKLLSEGGFAETSDKKNTTSSQYANLDLSQLNVILKSDEKELPAFRGNNLGRCDVQEWFDMMQLYLQKRNVNIPDQADEIISHLMGRARDVVKVSLHSNPTLDCKAHPELIYGMLKQHSCDVSYSSMPLADFYSTLPKHGENPVDYWLRLNKAADIADECLRAQGRSMDNLTSEIAMMFVRNCPDTDLARTFKVRPLENWIAKDVQELLDSIQCDRKSSKHK